ncbi:hypothetical protein [Synechococcus sp. WH 8101]|uniref:hypothetical protein n=1 Tax=Synechococcus sp. WH 8101 TaxID=59932 RepID=UPI0020C4327C|nr:hypothetical protein [Synechococcus sp. WH 8101]
MSVIAYKTELRAFLMARSQCLSTGETYRVFDHNGDVTSEVTFAECNRQLGAR